VWGGATGAGRRAAVRTFTSVRRIQVKRRIRIGTDQGDVVDEEEH